LPASFVMKANHGCGFVKVVRNKSTTSFAELSRLATKWLATDFYRASRERHYRPIERRIYFEKLLLDQAGNIPADFKMNVFEQRAGSPIIYTGVVSDRFGNIKGDFYDAQWNRLDLSLGDYRGSTAAFPRPPHWEEMLRVATLLAQDLGYVRVDLYAPDDEILFGELTFTPGAGVFPFFPDRYDSEWGHLLMGVKETASMNAMIDMPAPSGRKRTQR
ncbi:MAG TPA: ATP-grasp fold amidoligase family protein, partial [Trinickia sp.]|nr:ATP-grasp fold amidoligase family protein [Trinickia sp.]